MKNLKLLVIASLLAAIIIVLFTQNTQGIKPGSLEPIPAYLFHEVKIENTVPVIIEALPPTVAPTAIPRIQPIPVPIIVTSSSDWISSVVSWYGPGFYGNRTACGQTLTTDILGVAHRTLPCGTLVSFKYKDVIITVPVIDRGPYVAGRIWDLTGGLCTALSHCFTGSIEYRIIK